MTEIGDREKVKLTIIGILHSAGVKSYEESQKAAEAILSIDALAIVDREAELPMILTFSRDVETLLEAGWVKEIK